LSHLADRPPLERERTGVHHRLVADVERSQTRLPPVPREPRARPDRSEPEPVRIRERASLLDHGADRLARPHRATRAAQHAVPGRQVSSAPVSRRAMWTLGSVPPASQTEITAATAIVVATAASGRSTARIRNRSWWTSNALRPYQRAAASEPDSAASSKSRPSSSSA